MSTDEISSIHEILNNPVRNSLHLSGVFYWAWIIPGLIFVFSLLLLFRKFLTFIGHRFRKLFILSGAIYLSGAVGLEMIGGWIYSHDLGDSYLYVIEVVIEESLEMIGLLVFIYSLSDYLKSISNDLQISIK